MRRQCYEADEQQTLFEWVQVAAPTLPGLELLFHIPNGGSRNPLEAANLKRQGVRAGVPDLFLPVPKGNYHGLFIEMKAGKNTPTKSQESWLDALSKQGYRTLVCYGFEEARAVIESYLRMR